MTYPDKGAIRITVAEENPDFVACMERLRFKHGPEERSWDY